jgi:hypothetical protein
MRAEIEQLRAAQLQSDMLLAALASNDTSMKVLDQLRNAETMEAITKNLNHPGANTSALTSGITASTRFSHQQATEGAYDQQSLLTVCLY